MTRLEQALRWWSNHANSDGAQIPPRHYAVLRKAGYLTERDEDDIVDLNNIGRKALDGEKNEV
jgi:hypothetical protein